MGDRQHLWTDAFLAALAVEGVQTRAAELAGIDRSSVFRRRQADPEFDQACKDAMEAAADALEAEARRRALDGEREPVLYQGQPTYELEHDEAGYPIYDTVQEERPDFDAEGKPITKLVDVKRPRRKLDANGQPIILTVRKRSDSLLALLLKGRRKDVFAERREMTGKDGEPLPAAALIIATGVPDASDDEIA